MIQSGNSQGPATWRNSVKAGPEAGHSSGQCEEAGWGQGCWAFMVDEGKHGKKHKRPEKEEVNQGRYCHGNPK